MKWWSEREVKGQNKELGIHVCPFRFLPKHQVLGKRGDTRLYFAYTHAHTCVGRVVIESVKTATAVLLGLDLTPVFFHSAGQPLRERAQQEAKRV